MRVSNNILSPSTGYLILAVIVTFALAIKMSDSSMLGFGIILVLLFAFASSFDKGSSDANLRQLGWSNENLALAIPLGVIGGITTIFIGSLLIEYNSASASILVPDFSFAAQLSSVAIASSSLTIIFNIISQWFTVAPSEEALARLLGVKAFMSFFQVSGIAYIFSSLLWIVMHIPTYVMQNAPPEMYIILAIMSVVNIALLFITKNIFSAIISHGIFNTGVILLAVNPSVFVAIIVIILIISLFYYFVPKPRRNTA